MVKNRKNTSFYLSVSGAALFVLCLISLYLGPAKASPSEFISALCDVRRETPLGIIIYSVRLPRIIAAVLSGTGLAISGTLLQCITDNKMASPGLIGVNSGSGFAVILCMSLFPGLYRLTPLFSFCGAFLATLLIIALSKKAGLSKSALVLSGIALGSMLSAGISLISLADPDALVSYSNFSAGSLSGIELRDLWLSGAMIICAFILSLVFSRKFDLLMLGDRCAASLGLDVSRTRLIAMLLACASSAAAVSFSGLIGFVGLMAPHIAKRFAGERTENILPMAALTGAMLVAFSDLLGRTLFSPSEIPAGIFTSLAGAPFFLFLLTRKGGKRNA